MKTKIFTLLLAVAAGIGTMFADGTKIGNLYYNLKSSNKTAEVTFEDYYPNNYKNLTVANIPSKVEYGGETYNVTSIGKQAFIDCHSLTSVNIGENVTEIKSNAFQNCSSLTSITIPNSVESIGVIAFGDCTSMQSIIIGTNLTSLGTHTFSGCGQVRSITCYASWPPSCGANCFNGINKAIPVYVPAEALNYYKAADEWKEFYNIQAINTENIEDIHINNPTNSKLLHDGQILILHGDKTYTLQGQEVK